MIQIKFDDELQLMVEMNPVIELQVKLPSGTLISVGTLISIVEDPGMLDDVVKVNKYEVISFAVDEEGMILIKLICPGKNVTKPELEC